MAQPREGGSAGCTRAARKPDDGLPHTAPPTHRYGMDILNQPDTETRCKVVPTRPNAARGSVTCPTITNDGRPDRPTSELSLFKRLSDARSCY